MAGTTKTRERRDVFRQFEVKAIDEEARTFTGIAAAFSLDQGGDIILPGAFKRTLRDWKAAKTKRIVHLLDSHNRRSVRAVVGKMIDAQEVAGGLEATFQLIDGPDGEEVFRRIKGEYVDGLSIGYRAVEVRQPNDEERRQGVWRYLKEVMLEEVSVVVFPMNGDARIDLGTVKSQLEAGQPLADEQLAALRSLQEDVSALLSKVDPGEPAEPVTPPDSPKAGLATDDPTRLELEHAARAVLIRGLGAAR